jgi:hypothetical protein
MKMCDRSLWSGNFGEIVGTILGNISLCTRGESVAMGTRKWLGLLIMLAVWLCLSTVPAQADRGGHRFGGHGFRRHAFKGHEFRGHGFRHHRFRGPHRFGGPRVLIRPHIVVPFEPFWGPSWRPYAYAYPSPPVLVQPSPPVTAQPSPLSYWYYCDALQAYYPYVQQCPGGWRQVLPTPPP